MSQSDAQRAADLAEQRAYVTSLNNKAQVAESKGNTSAAEFFHEQINAALDTERVIANGGDYTYR